MPRCSDGGAVVIDVSATKWLGEPAIDTAVTAELFRRRSAPCAEAANGAPQRSSFPGRGRAPRASDGVGFAGAKARISLTGDGDGLIAQRRASVHHQHAPKARENGKSNVFDEMETKSTNFPEWKLKIADQVENGAPAAIMMLITLWALFADDIRLAGTDKGADDAFVGMTIFCLLAFTLELLALSFCKKDYFLGFYFLLDFVATGSLLFDIPEVNEGLYGSSDGSDGAQSTTLARASRTSRAGTKAGRIVRLVRLVRIVKLYKQWTMKKEERERMKNADLMDDELLDLQESRVGKKLSELTTRRVIVGVLAMLFILPTFEVDFHDDRKLEEWHLPATRALTETWLSPCHLDGEPYSYDELVDLNARAALNPSLLLGGANAEVKICNHCAGVIGEEWNAVHAARALEWRHCTTLSFQKALDVFCDNTDGVAGGGGELGWFDSIDRDPSSRPGIPCKDKSIAKLVIAVQADSSAQGTNHGDHGMGDQSANSGAVIVNDVERLDGLRDEEVKVAGYTTVVWWSPDATYVSSVSLDIKGTSRFSAILNILRTIFITIVLGAGAMLFSKDANELVLTPIERIIKRVRDIAENPLAAVDPRTKGADDDDGNDEQFEMVILEHSINKICSLLAIGFGEAGAEIIGENMRSGGDLNPMVPGRKMVAIFGFCDIRQFTDATEVLQGDVMEYVNSIGNIVHNEVSLHGGSANKNIGDAFLLVWKFPEHVTLDMVEDVVFHGADCPHEISEVADKALASFVVIVAALRRSARLAEYRKNKVLNERIPNFEVKMGFGLHVGWAIEGAIGSAHKIDASYLSPNVNMAARLEAATKQFRTPMLLSQDFVSILSPKAAPHVRQIDAVTVKGSKRPIGLYTFDVHTDDITPEPEGRSASEDLAEMTDEFLEHPDILSVQAKDVEFNQAFEIGFQAYQRGDWITARTQLERTLEIAKRPGCKSNPGPSISLLEVLHEHNFQAPPDWKGFRELTEK